jgi:hypothetical protein
MFMGGPPPPVMGMPPTHGAPPGMGMPPPFMGRPQMPPPGMASNMLPPHRIKEEALNPKNPTLYLQNLNERIKIPDLKNAIYQLFSNYGEVIEVHAKRNIKMRGQAFVIYRE